MQVMLSDNTPNIVVASTTSVTLASTNNGQPTTVTVGGQQWPVSSTLTLNTGATGANGLDTGTLGSIQLWYVYAIVNSGAFTAALIASQTGPSTGPTVPAGYFSAYKLVGAFYTNGSSQVGSAVSGIYTQATTSWMSYTSTLTGFGLSTTTLFWRRNGDSLEVEAEFISGTTTATTASASFPGSLTADTSKISAGTVIGPFGFNQSAASDRVLFNSTTAFNFGHGNQNVANGSDFGPGPAVTGFTARVPIVGWNATLL